MKQTHTLNLMNRGAISALLVGSMALISAPALATTNSPDELVVSEAEMSWGFKESFRAYISGNIAKGDWEASDGATYETPEFTWHDAEGTVDLTELTGEVHFTGAVEFSGHDGILSTVLQNPTLQFDGHDTAYLLLDVTGVSMADALAGDDSNVQTVDQVPFVELDLNAGDLTIDPDAGTVIGAAIPTEITEEGFAAFPNYEAGTAFDPLSFSIELKPGEATPEETASDETEPAESETQESDSTDPATPTSAEADDATGDPSDADTSAAADPAQDDESGISYGVVIAAIAAALIAGFAIYMGIRRKENRA